ncbi:MAG: hypothetical protein QW680_08405 [Pyrobaculum sp.]|uniref:Uncharacterized protein n=1 Tax=Pyrobaculum oguniense (strain DSM 13380 / JCM 10595 / TE7) TaxID=698757 RepID=H6QE08_PYROT|nr:hypothetical protein Pogu_ECE011 [Pyrobaculum oguniense TE7]MCY0889986.1 hypothetical protein [Pyrobaculum arsenaticum]
MKKIIDIYTEAIDKNLLHFSISTTAYLMLRYVIAEKPAESLAELVDVAKCRYVTRPHGISIRVDEETYEKIANVARISGLSISRVVSQLLCAFNASLEDILISIDKIV